MKNHTRSKKELILKIVFALFLILAILLASPAVDHALGYPIMFLAFLGYLLTDVFSSAPKLKF